MQNQLKEIRRYADVMLGKAQEIYKSNPQMSKFLFGYSKGIIRNLRSIEKENAGSKTWSQPQARPAAKTGTPPLSVPDSKMDPRTFNSWVSVLGKQPPFPGKLPKTKMDGNYTQRTREYLAAHPDTWVTAKTMEKVLGISNDQGSNVLNESFKSLACFRHYVGKRVWFRFNPDYDISRSKLRTVSPTQELLERWLVSNKLKATHETREKFAKEFMILSNWEIPNGGENQKPKLAK